MLSKQTRTELVNVLERMVTKDLDRMFHEFGLENEIHEFYGKKTNADKATVLLSQLQYSSKQGPYSGDLGMDMLRYKINHYYRAIDDNLGPTTYNYGPIIRYEDKFADQYKSLCYFLKKDGYVIEGREIRKLLPEEIEEAKTESELMRLMDKFGFKLAKEHLGFGQQALRAANWPGANSQFRNFIEALLADICKTLLPGTAFNGPAQAIKLLGSKINPPFLSESLNEVGEGNEKYPFVLSLWKRLHPEGSHPGLSNEDDATFRFHITVVFAYYLLNRLDEREKK